MQEELALVLENEPAMHGTHSDILELFVVPDGHGAQAALPSDCATVPLKHWLHEACPGLSVKKPYEQRVHDEAAIMRELEPALHDWHTLLAFVFVYSPEVQLAQTDRPENIPYKPGVQELQKVLPWLLEYVPTEQLIHELSPWDGAIVPSRH